MKCACPHCAGEIQNRPDIAGQWIVCPHCSQQFQLPALAVRKAIPVAMPVHANPTAPPIPIPQAVAPAYPQPVPLPPPLPPAPLSFPPAQRPRAAAQAESVRKPRRADATITIAVILVGVMVVGLIGIGGVFAWQQSQLPLVKKQANPLVVISENPQTPAGAKGKNKRTSDKRIESQSQPQAKRSSSPVDDGEKYLPNGKVDFIANATQAKYDRIHVGMAMGELFSFMGEPPSYKSDYEPDGRVDYYMWGSRGRYGIVFVKIKDGKVLSKSVTGRL